MKEPHQESGGEKLLRTVEKMSIGELLEWTGGMKREHLNFFVGSYEIERRKQKWSVIRSWISIGFSAVALIISIISLLHKL